MNFESIKGEWNELKGKFRAKWGKLTDEDIESFKSGNQQSFKDRLRERYGYSKERAEQEFEEFRSSSKLGEAKDNNQDPHSGDRLN